MSRSAVREIQVSGIRVRRGEVVVPTQIGDPVHGMLSCHAAQLVAGSLAAKGRDVRFAGLPSCDSPAGEFDATLYLATCPQEDGTTSAIAAAVSPGDALSATAARGVVEEWAAASATRTLLLAGSPWCSGALHAASAARQAASEHSGTGRKVHVLAPVAIPPETATELAELGAIIATSLTDVEPGDVVVLPAHGVTAEVRAEAARRGAIAIDATCPMVAAAQMAASRTADRDQQLVLISQPSQASTVAIASQAPRNVTVVESPAKTATLQISDSRQVQYLLQPGIAHEAAAPIIRALRARYPAVKGAVAADACYAPSDRAGTIYSVALGSDLMLVLGNPDAADTKQVCGQARDSGTHVQVIAQVADIAPAMLSGIQTIGVAESTSAQAGLAAQVLMALSGLGRLSVVRRKLSTEKSAAVLA
jgi:4-hydroxy-3-methylbut-2-en-1-yl diphosphate reductase